jgi:hypothetical protein
VEYLSASTHPPLRQSKLTEVLLLWFQAALGSPFSQIFKFKFLKSKVVKMETQEQPETTAKEPQ